MTKKYFKYWDELKGQVHPPILPDDIENFKQWISIKEFNFPSWLEHEAFDFGAYETTDGKKIFGLPSDTPIYAPWDGRVGSVRREGNFCPDPKIQVNYEEAKKYFSCMEIRHPDTYSLFYSIFVHVIPHVEPGIKVRRGEKIGVVHSISGNGDSSLPHLHFEMQVRETDEYSTGGENYNVNPIRIIFGEDYPFERIRLPRNKGGGYTKAELKEHGIETRYNRVFYK